jgi:hypothetical protein
MSAGAELVPLAVLFLKKIGGGHEPMALFAICAILTVLISSM